MRLCSNHLKIIIPHINYTASHLNENNRAVPFAVYSEVVEEMLTNALKQFIKKVSSYFLLPARNIKGVIDFIRLEPNYPDEMCVGYG